MNQSDIVAPILSYDDINKQAEDFLRENKRNKTFPVDIEAIAEFDLNLNIFPFPNLQVTFDIEGFISGDLDVIYVDEFIYYQRPARYRFTLAHEIGHYVFHSDLIASFHPQSVAAWSKFVLGIDEETYGWLEWQALKEPYQYLLTLPGVGKILSLTIMLETGPINRFETVGDYVSYCRKVPSQWMSNGKWKGAGNRKNGNKYLAWAYSEASEFARQLHPEPRAYYNRKMQKTNAAVAHSALANKLSRAGYYVMRDQVPFRAEKLFG